MYALFATFCAALIWVCATTELLQEQELAVLTEVRVAQDVAALGDPKGDWWWASVCRRKGKRADGTADKVPKVKVGLFWC